MGDELYKYTPEDFGALSVTVKHMDLHFDVFDDHTIVLSKLYAQVRTKPIKELELNAKNLEIHEVSCDVCDVDFTYEKERDMLIVRFARELNENESFVITTKTTCRPTKHVLEGIYFDETPAGAPPTQITQCQQWGFQRIVPCIDDMTAKCTYSTVIIANEKYTNYLTNGDPTGEIEHIGEGRVKATYDNTITPMATYLFFLGVGTYDTFVREFEYPNGDTFMLELLVPPGSDTVAAKHALDVLYDAVMWVYVFTGAKRYERVEDRYKIWELVKQRELLKAQGENLDVCRQELKTLWDKMVFGYKYTGKVYREIGMQNSDFGGMENVGNTTITTNRIMPFKHMSDGSFEYMIRVKVHEYYHNLNGSEVTGWSPFEIWLNEAVTVHIEREYHAFLFGEDYARLQQVIHILSPGSGTLAQDMGVQSMPIEPDGFNDTNELITGITYVKAPEFVRMIQTVLGKEVFNKGLYLYYARYKHANATRAQWIACMEEASGIALKDMAQAWLKRSAYPIVKASYEYDHGDLNVQLIQTHVAGPFWPYPIHIEAFDESGKLLVEHKQFVESNSELIEGLACGKKPAYVTFNRGYIFYGKLQVSQSEEQLKLLVRTHPDVVSRFLAYSELMNREKMRLLENENENEAVSEEIIDLYFELLNNEELMQKAGSQFLAIFESVDDKCFAHSYTKLFNVREKISTTIAQKYKQELINLYQQYAAKTFEGSYMEQKVAQIKNRRLKNKCLGLLSHLDEPEIHALIKKQFETASCATDKVVAFGLYLDTNASDREELLQTYQQEAAKHLVSWETFLYSVAGCDAKETIDWIKKIESSEQFRIEQTNDQRGLFVYFATNRKRSLETEEGRAFLKEIILKLTPINEYTVGRVLPVFGNLDKMEAQFHEPLVKILVDVLDAIDENERPSVFKTIKRILTASTVAKKTYEEKHGAISYLS